MLQVRKQIDYTPKRIKHHTRTHLVQWCVYQTIVCGSALLMFMGAEVEARRCVLGGVRHASLNMY